MSFGVSSLTYYLDAHFDELNRNFDSYRHSRIAIVRAALVEVFGWASQMSFLLSLDQERRWKANIPY